MKMRMKWPYFITFMVFIGLFILGTFVDYNISSKVASSTNKFALAVSIVGVIPCHAVVSILGGGWLSYTFNKNVKLVFRILAVFACILYLGIAIYYTGREFFSPNGFTNSKLMWLGYVIAAPIMLGCCYFGVYLARKLEIKQLWVVLLVITIALTLSIMVGINLLKAIFHRPRFRFITAYNQEFYPWYKRCSDYKDLMTLTGVTSEEFKSFPSGHMSSACVLPAVCLLLPLISDKMVKYQKPVFYASLGFAVLVALSRILAAAHYLSDVSFGAIMTFGFVAMAYPVLNKLRNKKDNSNEEGNISAN